MSTVPRAKRTPQAQAIGLLKAAKDKGQKAIDSGAFVPTPKPVKQKATKGVVPDDPSLDLMLAAMAIFDGGTNEVEVTGIVPGTRKTVTIYPATMDKLPQVMMFFGGVVEGLDPAGLASLVDVVVMKQKLAIGKGQDPNKVDLRELATEEMVEKAFTHSSLLASLLAAVFKLMPEMVEAFTDITADHYRKLTIDEGALLAGGVFMQNYRFFTRTVPPMLTAFMRSWASKRADNAGSTVKAK